MLEIISHEGDMVELRLANPPANAMDHASLVALNRAFDEVGHDAGIILSGMPGVFSSGIDVLSLLNGDAEAVHAYWREVFALAARMARSPLPVVAAITGHCLAAGTLLALFSDQRVMAAGNWGIGLNEVRAGVALPDCFQLALRRVVGARQAETMLVSGQLLDAQAALGVGLVDELAAPDEVVARARARLAGLLALPRHSMLATRAIARRDLHAAFADLDALPVQGFVDDFLAPPTQAALRRVAADIKGRRGQGEGAPRQAGPAGTGR